ncbi:hypothetical protein BD410DRAFT_793597 [Rickenella mellea]|uniref:Nudix hydrolase domain-containing protein n=1 Tax=Rickenella mellea TaxID=50990 RepID=A0A4Y7PSR3_9AGAM|nr:hypothetical protein BD410DRAFT_793597 [Rickenella mellea]
MRRSFLHVVERCDNFRPVDTLEHLYAFALSSNSKSESVVGLIRPNVLAAINDDNLASSHQASFVIDSTAQRLSFASHITTPEDRSNVIADLCARWRSHGLFSDVIGGRLWRNELYAVYANPFGQRTAGSAAFTMERSACALFGVITYGVHMTIYHPPVADNEEVKIWVPKRAATKQTWPGYLDNSVAGGIPAGEQVFDTIIKESMEEASITEHTVRAHARSVGAISYFYRTEKGYLQPEVEFVYHMAVPLHEQEAFQLKPLDGEVESFALMSISDVISNMHEGKFKPNCAVVLLDFLIHHGHVTPDNEPHFLEITTRMHGRFDFDRW